MTDPTTNQFAIDARRALRDQFAMAALTGMGTWMPYSSRALDLTSADAMKARAEWAYLQADAMLRERDKRDAA